MGPASTVFTPPQGQSKSFCREGAYMPTGRKEIGRKMCKAGRACGPGTESWERNSAAAAACCSCGLGKVTCGETTPPLCSATTQARLQLELEMCAEKSGCLKSRWQIGWKCSNQHLVASFVSLGRFHNSRAVSEPPWTMPEATW